MGDFEQFLVDKQLENASIAEYLALRIGWINAKQRYQPKWISVNDQLPTVPKAYAVKKHGWECPFIRVWLKGNIWGDNNISPITHWMEIPE